MTTKIHKKTDDNVDELFGQVSHLIEQARSYVKTAANTAEVYTKYFIGKYIVEYEQHGQLRAEYGKQVLIALSDKLTNRYGAGRSYASIRNIRQFYVKYATRITTDSPKNANHWLANSHTAENQPFKLSWSHYLVLMRIENSNARSFYEIECVQQ